MGKRVYTYHKTDIGREIRHAYFLQRKAAWTPLPADTKRICSKCKVEQPLSEFRKQIMGPKGYNGVCKTCTKPYDEARRLRFKVDSWEKVLIRNIRGRELRTKHGVCELTHKDILEMYEAQNGLCYWFNIPMLTCAPRKTHPQKLTIDRLDPSVRYLKGNVVLACYAANIGRNNTSVNDWLDFLKLAKLGIAQSR